MRKHTLIAILFGDTDELQKVSAAKQLEAYLSDTDVVLALCIVTLQTESHRLRSAIIKILKNIEKRVNPYFARVAMRAKSASLRKWALVNLSLMECKNAKPAVMSGLKDSSSLVQQAAVLNIGLYRDTDFLKEVEKFFERNTSTTFIFVKPDPNHPKPNTGRPQKKQR